MPVFCCCSCFVLFCFWRLSSGIVTYVVLFLVLRIILQARFYFHNTSTNKYYKHYCLNYEKSRSFPYHHHRHHLSLNRECRWGTIDDFTTSFLHFPCSPLPCGTWRTPGLSIPWYCLPASFSVCLVFFSLSLCLARLFWPDLMNGRHVHTTAVCVSLRWSEDFRVVRFPLDLGTDYLGCNIVFVWDA